MRFKRIVSGILVCSMLCGGVTVYNCCDVHAKYKIEDVVSCTERLQKNDENNKKDYILSSVRKEDIERIKDVYVNDILEEYDEYEAVEDSLVGISLTEDEAEKIEEVKGIVVEEDVIVEACKHNKINKIKPSKSIKEHKQIYKDMINADEEIISKERKKNKYIKDKSSDAIKVAILDSGIDGCSSVNVQKSINLIPGEEDVTWFFEDMTGHGTAVAGIISSQNENCDIAGINNNVEIYSAKVLDSNNQAPLSRIIEGIYWAIDEGVDIINMSFGLAQESAALKTAIDKADEEGILMIAAVGNDSEKGVLYPAAYDNVLGVGSVDTKAEHSECSATGKGVDVVAIGEQVVTTGVLDGIVVTDGTSMAVPQVVGVASLLWEKDRRMSSRFIRELIKESSNALGDKKLFGKGLIDLEEAYRIYDEFKEIYSEESDVGKIVTSVDEYEDKAIDTYEFVNCVEGQWYSGEHEDVAENGAKAYSYTPAELNLIKLGSVFNDETDYYNPSTNTGSLRGLRKETYGDNGDWHGRGGRKYNFVAAFKYVYSVALDGINTFGDGKPSYMKKQQYTRMKKAFKGVYKKDNEKCAIRKYMKAKKGIATPTAKNNKDFVFGMSLHILADTFAHATYEKKGSKYKYISHDEVKINNEIFLRADLTDVAESRYKAAKQAVKNAMKLYKEGSNNVKWIYYNEMGDKKYNAEEYKIRGLAARCNDTLSNVSTAYMNRFKGISEDTRDSDKVSAIKAESTPQNGVIVKSGAAYDTVSLEKILFDYDYYYSLYPDLQQAIGYNETALRKHYNTYGKKEGRTASVFFDPGVYLSYNYDVVEMYGYDYKKAYNHYVNTGFWEGRFASTFFDVEYYIEKYDDLFHAYCDDYLGAIKHFRYSGMNEFRAGSELFDVGYYRAHNADLYAAFGADAKSYFKFYNMGGWMQGRPCVDETDF